MLRLFLARAAPAIGKLKATPPALGPVTCVARPKLRLPPVEPRTKKAMGKKNFYAVVRGHTPGIYRSWDECSRQVNGFRGNMYKGFNDEGSARRFLEDHSWGSAPGGASSAPAHDVAAAIVQAFLQRDADAAAHEPQEYEYRSRDAAAPSLPSTSALPAVLPGSGSGRRLRLEFDGASRRNPGPSGLGAALFDEDTGQEVATLAHYLGDRVTNNQAEYAALIAGMKAALDSGCRDLVAQGDSMLVVNQVLGRWQVKHAGLAAYHAAATVLAARFDSFTARQVPRAQNKVADALSNRGIDDYESGAARRTWTLANADAGGQVAAAEHADGEGAPLRKRQRRL